MNLSWHEWKEIFYTIGSAAGVIALARPVFESKHQRDVARFEQIRSSIGEDSVVGLVDCVYMGRVPDSVLVPLDRLVDYRDKNHDTLRFSGPLARYFLDKIDALIAAYHGLREYIQVPEWEPHGRFDSDGTNYFEWRFNKEAFAKEHGYPTGYASHLDEARNKAVEIKNAYQQLQIVAELHLYEAPFAKWLLPRRFKKLGLVTTDR